MICCAMSPPVQGAFFRALRWEAAWASLAAVAVGLNRRIERLFDPSFQGLRAIPSLAWVPLLLLWMGIDEMPKITLIAIGAFFLFI